MTMTSMQLLLPCSLLAVAAMSCGGAPAKVVRPDAPTAVEALGEVECNAASNRTTPLVIDWSSQQRVDLEVAMKKGIVALRYDCEQVEILSSCNVSGAYQFVGVSRKEEVVSLASSDELRASLPVGAAKFAAEVAGDAKLDLAMILVGKSSAGVAAVSRGDLPPGCEKATHVVRSATQGAFAIAQGSEGKMMTAAEAFGAGVGAASSSTRDALSKDGDLEACRTSQRDAPAPPEGCGASVRLELEPINEGAAPPLPVGPPAVLAIACPSGTAVVDGLCRAAAHPHVCAPSDEADCAKQCDAGNLESCYHLGRARLDWTPTGLSGSPRQTEARPLLERACKGGVLESCLALGEVAMGEAAGGGVAAVRSAVVEADGLWAKPCEAGIGRACALRSHARADTRPLADPASHFAFARRACGLGDGLGCSLLANAYIRGTGTEKMRGEGYAVLERACEAADVTSCRRLAVVRYSGSDQAISPTISGLVVNKEQGIRYALRTCALDEDACGISRTIEFVDKAVAQQFREDMCKAGRQRSCS